MESTKVKKKSMTNNLSFEEVLSELETITNSLETGRMNLSDAVNSYTRGVQLKEIAMQQLNEAKLTLKMANHNEYNELRQSVYSIINSKSDCLVDDLIACARDGNLVRAEESISNYGKQIMQEFIKKTEVKK